MILIVGSLDISLLRIDYSHLSFMTARPMICFFVKAFVGLLHVVSVAVSPLAVSCLRSSCGQCNIVAGRGCSESCRGGIELL